MPKIKTATPPIKPPDRFPDVWRTAVGPGAVALVANALTVLLAYEADHGLRKRGRKAADLLTLRKGLDGILADQMLVALDPNEKRGTAVTLSKQFLGKASRYKPKWMSETLPYLLGLLAHMGFIRLEKGWEGLPGHKGQRTLIWPGKRLILDMETLGVTLDQIGKASGQECIVLKRIKDQSLPKKKVFQEYIDNDATLLMRRQMAVINSWIRRQDIAVDEACLPSGYGHDDCALRREFTRGDFDNGGRAFGGFWQQMSKNDRFEAITINDQPIAEVDFNQIGPRLAYYLARKQAGADLHAPIADNHYSYPGVEPRYREGMKIMFNAMLFAEKPFVRKPEASAKLLPARMTVKDLCALIEVHHPELKNSFYKGVGHKIQRLESDLIIAVLLRLRSHGIVGLPIHDAVLVPWADRERVRELMEVTALSMYPVGIIASVEEREIVNDSDEDAGVVPYIGWEAEFNKANGDDFDMDDDDDDEEFTQSFNALMEKIKSTKGSPITEAKAHKGDGGDNGIGANEEDKNGVLKGEDSEG